jgi:cobalt-zinc-cadmium efflux system membrane fusion protein
MNGNIHNLILRSAALGCLVLLGCSNESASDTSTASASTAAPFDPMEIRPGDALAGRFRLGRAETAQVASALTVTARLDVDARRVTRVGSPVLGRISALYREEGEEVRRGEPLATLDSTGMNEAQLGLLKALSQHMVAERAAERARLLLKADVIGSAELQRREAELAQASAEHDAARDELALLGFSPEEIRELEAKRTIRSSVRITAPRDGTVVHRHVALGQVIVSADTAFEIADLSNLWIVAEVPEQEAGGLKVGQEVSVHITAFPASPIQGRLSFVSALVNPETRTVLVRMDLPNPDRRFKPSMLAELTLHGHPQPHVVVPEPAIVREGQDAFVFVERTPGVFQLRPVKLGPAWGARRVVLEGLRGGEPIMTGGAFHINNERRQRNLRKSG